MAWKNLKYPLFGGIICFCILLLIVIINGMFSGAMTPTHTFFDNSYRALVSPMNALFESDEIGFNILIYSFIFYFIVGALIGWILGKRKSSKK